MISIKNAIVTVTVLAVGYGASVVLNNPPERDFNQIASQQGADTTAQPTNDATNARQRNAASTQSTSPPLETEPPIDVSLGPIPSHDSPAIGKGPFEQAWQTTEHYVRENNLGQALATLSAWHNDQTLNQQQRARCLRRLDQLAGTVIYSRQYLIEPEYEVQAGETLNEIAIRYAVPQELLAKINGIVPPFALATGEMLKIVRGPFRAEVSMSSGQLTLFLGSYYAGRIPVRIGRDLPAQAAFYEVAEKSHGRSYFDRQMGREVMTGEASNRYGNHWVGLRGDQTTAGHSVGIHGRPSDATEGEIGSISLNPLDAEDVFSILSIGSRVHVRR